MSDSRYTVISSTTPLGISESELKSYFQKFGTLHPSSGVKFFKDRKRFGIEFKEPKSALRCFKALYKKPNNEIFGLTGGVWELYFGSDIKLFAEQKSFKLPVSEFDPFKNREIRQISATTPEPNKSTSGVNKRPLPQPVSGVSSAKKPRTKLVRRRNNNTDIDTESLLKDEVTASAIPSIVRATDLLVKVSTCLSEYDSSLLGLNKLQRPHPATLMNQYTESLNSSPSIIEGSYAELMRGIYKSAGWCTPNLRLSCTMVVPETMKAVEHRIAANMLSYAWQDLSTVPVFKQRRPLSFTICDDIRY